MSDPTENKKVKVIIVGAAWYGDWAKNFYLACKRLGYDTSIVYNNFLPESLGGNNTRGTHLFEKAKFIIRRVSPAAFRVLKSARQHLSDKETLQAVRKAKIHSEKTIVIFTWTPGSKRVLERLKRWPGVKLVLWLGEPTARDSTWEPKFDYFDEFYIIDDGKWVDVLADKNKKRAKLLPLAGDETLFYPLSPEKIGRKADVVFIGKYYRYKAKILEQIKDYDLKIYGYGWEEGIDEMPWIKDKYFGSLPTSDLNLIYNGAKLAIGTIGTPKDPFTTVTMRTFDIALSGTFQICEDSHLARKLFGDTIGVFKEEADIKRLVDYYLAHDEERKALAVRSREIALNYTYAAAAKKILESI